VVQVTRTVAEVRETVQAARRAGRRIGLVPTMGFLHEGHLSLIRRAAKDCDDVVVSVFVNPTQFNDPADLAAYPRNEENDVAMAASAGATMVFAPPVEEVYPAGFATTVELRGPITETFEGAVRGPEHFWGVATVVTKLFGMVQPDAAYFGQKDAQQCVVVSRLATDLDLPVELVICPTVREPDGLAMSSRNVRLRGDDRDRALALVDGLDAADAAVRAGETDAAEVESVATKAMLARGVGPDYVAVVDPTTLAPLERIAERALIVVAAHVGPVRLIDNAVLDRT
jgi:pantoate--beta-alanine ligase